jgi:hypothetical protein
MWRPAVRACRQDWDRQDQALRTGSFEQAERGRNAETLLAHFARVPEFHIYSDGNRLPYDAMAAYIRETFPTLRAIEGGFVDLHIIVLAPDAALATGTFREATTDVSGNTGSRCCVLALAPDRRPMADRLRSC